MLLQLHTILTCFMNLTENGLIHEWRKYAVHLYLERDFVTISTPFDHFDRPYNSIDCWKIAIGILTDSAWGKPVRP